MSEMTEALARHREAFETYLIRSTVNGCLVPADKASDRAADLDEQAGNAEHAAWKDLLLVGARNNQELARYALHLAVVAKEFDTGGLSCRTEDAFEAMCNAARFLAGWEAMQ